MEKRDPDGEPERDSKNEPHARHKISADLSSIELNYRHKRSSANKEPPKAKRVASVLSNDSGDNVRQESFGGLRQPGTKNPSSGEVQYLSYLVNMADEQNYSHQIDTTQGKDIPISNTGNRESEPLVDSPSERRQSHQFKQDKKVDRVQTSLSIGKTQALYGSSEEIPYRGFTGGAGFASIRKSQESIGKSTQNPEMTMRMDADRLNLGEMRRSAEGLNESSQQVIKDIPENILDPRQQLRKTKNEMLTINVPRIKHSNTTLNVLSPRSPNDSCNMSRRSHRSKSRRISHRSNTVRARAIATSQEKELAEKIRASSGTIVQSMDDAERDRRLQKLAMVIGVFQNIADLGREDRLIEDLMSNATEKDPTPDLVEGIFTLDKTSYYDRCCKKNLPDSAIKQKIVVYDRRSLYLFDHNTSFRKLVVALAGSNAFEAFIVLAIFFNSIILAITDYSDRDNETVYNQKLEKIGMIFSIIFTVELVIKVIAMGFIMHKKSYMRDPWNWLDFTVVCTGLIELSVGSEGAASVRALRVLRVLRPLKSINAFPKMRRLIGALLSSLPNLGNAVFFMLFIFLLFGILGVQQFGGITYQRCRTSDEPFEDGSWPQDDTITRLCSKDSSGNFECPADRFCHSPADEGLGIEIDSIENDELIDFGISSFDNLAIGLITVFQMITLEGWTKIMYNLQDAGITWMAILFSIMLIVIGSFFLLNVILAVLAEALTKVDEVQMQAEAKLNKQIHQSLKRRKKQDKKAAIARGEPVSDSEKGDLSSQIAKSSSFQGAINGEQSSDPASKPTTELNAEPCQEVIIQNRREEPDPPLLFTQMVTDNKQYQSREPLIRESTLPFKLDVNLSSQLDDRKGSIELRMDDYGQDPSNLKPGKQSSRNGDTLDGKPTLSQNNNQTMPVSSYFNNFISEEDDECTPQSKTPLTQSKRPHRLGQPQNEGKGESFTQKDPPISQTQNGEKQALSLPYICGAGDSPGLNDCDDMVVPSMTPFMQPIAESLAEQSQENSNSQQPATNRNLLESVNQDDPDIGAQVEKLNKDNSMESPGKDKPMMRSSTGGASKILGESTYSVATNGALSGFFSINENNLPPRARKNFLFKLCFIICTHWMFTVAITLLIIVNTIALAMDSYPKNLQREEIANQMNDIFSWCFTAEMVIKLIGLGFKEYTRDTFNIFDAVLVIISLVDYAILQIPSMTGGTGGALTAFRGVRLLRVFKLARSWTSFRELLSKIILTVKEITTFSILLIICMFIFMLLGMEIFGHKVAFDPNGEVIKDPTDLSIDRITPRPNFNNLYMAFTSIFIVFIGEDWQLVMHSHYRVEGLISIAFFTVMYIFLNLILLNLFLAILLQNFETASEEENKKDPDEKIFARLIKKVKKFCCFCCVNKRVNPDGVVTQSLSSELSESDLDSQQSNESNVDDMSDQSESSYASPTSQAEVSGRFGLDTERQNVSNSGLAAVQPPPHGQPQVSPVTILSQSLDELEGSKEQSRAKLDLDDSKVQSKEPTIMVEASDEYQVERRDKSDISAFKSNQDEPARQSALDGSPDKSRKVFESNNGSSLSQLKIENKANQTVSDHHSRQHSKLGDDVFAEAKDKKTKQKGLYRHKTADAKKMFRFARMPTMLVGRRMSVMEISKKKDVITQKKQLLRTSTRLMSLSVIKKQELLSNEDIKKKKKIALTGKACGIFSPESPIRRLCKYIVELKYFDSCVLALIGLSTILLTLDNPLNDENGKMAQVLSKIDYLMTALFTLECIINICVCGFLMNGPNSYLKDSWNVLDFMIVLFSLVSVATVGLNLEILKVFRMLRVLRPLRVLKRNFGLKIQVVSLLNSIPGITNLLTITMLLLMLFGIQGVNFFAGKMVYCNMTNIPESVQAKIHSEWDCYDYGGEWLTYDSNFDNVGTAMLTMFTMMTTEGWIEVMWLGVDATEIHQVPQENYRPIYIIFFIAFLIFGSLFILNLFVGVVLNTFNKEKDTLSNSHQLTRLQTEYLEVMKNCYIVQPERLFYYTGNKLRDMCKDIAINDWFNHFILACIIFNSVCLAITWFGEPEKLVLVMEWINIAFTIIYTIEMVIKMIAFARQYFDDGWNVFDFLIVFFAWVGLFMEFVFKIEIGALTTVVRAFRILRVLKLIRKARNLQKILNTFLLAIPELANVGALLFLFLFLFSILGIFLFSGIRLQENLDHHANFQHFGSALMTLFRVTTGEGWQQIMYDCARQRDITFQCVDKQTYEEQQRDGINGCGTPMAYVYFVTFTLVVSLIFLNLFIAIILEGQLQATQQQEARVGEQARNAFLKSWSKYDPDATGFIKIDDLQELIFDLVEQEINIRAQRKLSNNKDVLFYFTQHNQIRVLTKLNRNMDLNDQEAQIKDNARIRNQLERSLDKFIGDLQIPIYNKMEDYNFHDVLHALVFHVFAYGHKKQFEERKKRIDVAKAIGNFESLNMIDQVTRGDYAYWQLSIQDQELFLEQDDSDFQTVINRLENKGNTADMMILKLEEVRKLRIKTGIKNKYKLALDHEGDMPMDSGHIQGTRIFQRLWKERNARIAKRKAEEVLVEGMTIQEKMLREESKELTIAEQITKSISRRSKENSEPRSGPIKVECMKDPALTRPEPDLSGFTNLQNEKEPSSDSSFSGDSFKKEMQGQSLPVVILAGDSQDEATAQDGQSENNPYGQIKNQENQLPDSQVAEKPSHSQPISRLVGDQKVIKITPTKAVGMPLNKAKILLKESPYAQDPSSHKPNGRKRAVSHVSTNSSKAAARITKEVKLKSPLFTQSNQSQLLRQQSHEKTNSKHMIGSQHSQSSVRKSRAQSNRLSNAKRVKDQILAKISHDENQHFKIMSGDKSSKELTQSHEHGYRMMEDVVSKVIKVEESFSLAYEEEEGDDVISIDLSRQCSPRQPSDNGGTREPQEGGHQKSIKVSDAEFDALTAPYQKQNTKQTFNGDYSDKNLKVMWQPSDGNGLMKKYSLRSRVADETEKPIFSMMADDDMDGGQPAPTEPSQMIPGASDIDMLSSQILVQGTSQQAQANNGKPSMKLADVQQKKKRGVSSSIKTKNQGQQQQSHVKRKKYRLQLDSKGGEAASQSQRQSDDIRYLSGSPVEKSNLREPVHEQNHDHSGAARVMLKKQLANTRMAGSIISIGGKSSQKDTFRKQASSRMILSLKEAKNESLNRINTKEAPALHRSRTTAYPKNSVNQETFSFSNKDMNQTSPVSKRMLSAKPKEVNGMSQMRLQNHQGSGGGGDYNGTSSPGLLVSSKSKATINPGQINYRKGNFAQRSLDRQKRLMSAYMPQDTKKSKSASKPQNRATSPQK